MLFLNVFDVLPLNQVSKRGNDVCSPLSGIVRSEKHFRWCRLQLQLQTPEKYGWHLLAQQELWRPATSLWRRAKLVQRKNIWSLQLKVYSPRILHALDSVTAIHHSDSNGNPRLQPSQLCKLCLSNASRIEGFHQANWLTAASFLRHKA